MKKNCHNCIYLDYYHADYESTDKSGFYCKKRELMNGSEEKLLKAINTESYREKSKVCHVGHIEVHPDQMAIFRTVERVPSGERKWTFDRDTLDRFYEIRKKVYHNRGIRIYTNE